jgi:hypothetical protein
MKGVVSCKLVDKGAAVTVIYCKADAPAAEWSKLTAEPAPPAADAAPDAAKVLGDNAQVYQFPDGTGSITIAEGWKTQAPSAIGPIFIQGPGEQGIFIGSSIMVYTPESPMLKMMQQNQARMRQMGVKSPPPPMFVGEFTDPAQAMKDLTPQMSQLSQSRGGPAVQLDEITSEKDIPAGVPNGKAAIVTWKVTRTLNGEAKHYRGSQKIQMSQMPQGSTWMYVSTGFTAPADTFDHDKTIMFAMINSENVDADVVARRLREMNEQEMAMIKQQGEASSAALQASHDQFMRDQAQRFADGQARHAEQEAGYAAHNQQFNEYENQRSRNKDNQVEQILGYRTVYDTQTGLSTTADLSDVNGVVNSLNAAALDPNRFVQIPLRDQQDPTVGQ